MTLIASLGRAASGHAQAAQAARFSTTADRHWEEFDAAVNDLLAAMAEADGRGLFGRIETLLSGVRT
ncbi:hypothetical protein EBL89_18245 [Cereibacter sphaeroides]|nr:hypothetical protein EBL89_18245 [Cereibacter sphaeroides]AZB61518.1 hypothetical protein EBL88_18355 [Cereibacter sphaeroides]